MSGGEYYKDILTEEEQDEEVEVQQEGIQDNIEEEKPILVVSKPMYPEEEPTDNSKFWVRKMNEGTPGGPLAPNGK